MILLFRSKKYGMLPPLPLTGGAEPEEIQPMTGDPKTCFRNQFLRYTVQTFQIRVDDFLASGADEVWVRIGFVAVIPIAPLREPKLQHLVQFFEKGHGLVNRGQACR